MCPVVSEKIEMYIATDNDQDNDRHKVMTKSHFVYLVQVSYKNPEMLSIQINWPCHEQDRKFPDVLYYTTILPSPRYIKKDYY